MAFLLFLFQHLRSSHLLFASLVALLLFLDSEAIRSRAPSIPTPSLFLFVFVLLIAIKQRPCEHGTNNLAIVRRDEHTADYTAIVAVTGGDDGFGTEILVVSSPEFPLEELEFHNPEEESLPLVNVTTVRDPDPELGGDNLCRDLVPAPPISIDVDVDQSPPAPPEGEDQSSVEIESPVSSPRKKTIKKKRRKKKMAPPASRDELVLAATTNSRIVVGVDRLIDCSLDDFNRACSAIINLHRQEWQLR